MWKITSINNATHQVTLENHHGKKLHFTVPHTHHAKHLKHQYIRSIHEAHDKKHALINEIIFSAIVLLAASIFTYLRFH